MPLVLLAALPKVRPSLQGDPSRSIPSFRDRVTERCTPARLASSQSPAASLCAQSSSLSAFSWAFQPCGDSLAKWRRQTLDDDEASSKYLVLNAVAAVAQATN